MIQILCDGCKRVIKDEVNCVSNSVYDVKEYIKEIQRITAFSKTSTKTLCNMCIKGNIAILKD